MSDKQRSEYQQTMFDSERPATPDSGPVTCLGMTFENEGTKIILPLIGGDKSSQKTDIKTAKAFWEKHRERKAAEKKVKRKTVKKKAKKRRR